MTWQEKRRYHAVRFSAIPHVYGDAPVTASGGPGQATVRLPASRWQSYIPLVDHPEYPSASACVCEAQAQAMRRYTGKDSTDGWDVSVPAGALRIEPGVTPAQDLTFSIDTWTDSSRLCGRSRVWGGTHFPFAVDEATRECSLFGDLAYEYFRTLVDGTAPAARRERRAACRPASGRPLGEVAAQPPVAGRQPTGHAHGARVSMMSSRLEPRLQALAPSATRSPRSAGRRMSRLSTVWGRTRAK